MSDQQRDTADEWRAIMNAVAESALEAPFDEVEDEVIEEGAQPAIAAEAARRALRGGIPDHARARTSSRSGQTEARPPRGALMRTVQRLPYAGGVDADGHILEAPDLWERHLEPRYRERALRLRRDTHGLE